MNSLKAAFFANTLSENESRSPCYTLNGCSTEKDPGEDMDCSSVAISDTCTGYRLPTEAQWEFASRATTTTAYANPVYFDSSNIETDSGFNSNLNAMGWYKYNNNTYMSLEPSRWVSSRLTPGDCMTCTVMYGNGAKIGGIFLIIHRTL